MSFLSGCRSAVVTTRHNLALCVPRPPYAAADVEGRPGTPFLKIIPSSVNSSSVFPLWRSTCFRKFHAECGKSKALLDAIPSRELLLDSSLLCNLLQEFIGCDLLPASSTQSELLFALFGTIFKKGVPGLPSTLAAAYGGRRTRSARLCRVVTTADLQPDKNKIDIEFALHYRCLGRLRRAAVLPPMPASSRTRRGSMDDAVMLFGEARLSCSLPDLSAREHIFRACRSQQFKCIPRRIDEHEVREVSLFSLLRSTGQAFPRGKS